MEGKVIKFLDKKGFGFIRSGQDDYFFHINSVIRGENEDAPGTGDKVEFEIKENPKGREAISVRVIS